MDFEKIDEHIIDMGEFELNWRFTDDKYALLSDEHLKELKPLDKKASKFLNDFIFKSTLHNQIPFKKGFFRFTDNTKILEGEDKSITKWLYQRAMPFDKTVYLSWGEETSMKTKWKFVVKYWGDLFYGGSDDVTVFDESLQWSLLFFHEDELYWGTNKQFESSNEYDESKLIY